MEQQSIEKLRHSIDADWTKHGLPALVSCLSLENIEALDDENIQILLLATRRMVLEKLDVDVEPLCDDDRLSRLLELSKVRDRGVSWVSVHNKYVSFCYDF